VKGKPVSAREVEINVGGGVGVGAGTDGMPGDVVLIGFGVEGGGAATTGRGAGTTGTGAGTTGTPGVVVRGGVGVEQPAPLSPALNTADSSGL
jgi:hypothetical protein